MVTFCPLTTCSIRSTFVQNVERMNTPKRFQNWSRTIREEAGAWLGWLIAAFELIAHNWPF